MKKLLVLILLLVSCAKTPTSLKKVDFVLDWVPNTNHTGLYVAKEKGYFKSIGIDLNIVQPPEGSAVELIANNKAFFGISFQDTLLKQFEKKVPITVVAAIIENNTSGMISNQSLNVITPKHLANKRYGTWNDPIELAMVKTIMEKENVSFDTLKLIPNNADNTIVGLVNNQFDVGWVYYGWDKIMSDHQNLPMNFFFLKDFANELNYYSPVIIANNAYLKNKHTEAKNIMSAIKKGYQYAMQYPDEASDILVKHVPELQRDFVVKSQRWLAKNYASDINKWGMIDSERWNRFFEWAYENKLVETPFMKNEGYTNAYVEN